MSGRGGRGRGRGKFVPPTAAKLQLQKAAEECGYDPRNLRALQHQPDLFPDILLHSSGQPMREIQKLQQQQQQEEEEEEKEKQEKARQKQNIKVEVADDDKSRRVSIKMEDGQTVTSGGGGRLAKKNAIKMVKRSAHTTKLIQKGREMHHRMQKFHIRVTKDVPDILRADDEKKLEGDYDKDDAVKAVMMHCLGGRKATKQGLFLPDELVYGPHKRRRGWLTNDGGDDGNNKKQKTIEELEKEEKLRLRRIRLGIEQEEEDAKEENEFLDEFEDQEEQDDGGYGVNYYESEGEESMGDGDGENYI